MIDSNVVKGLTEISKENVGTSAYDTPADVIRIDGNTVWAHIPGGVEETPVAKTVNCNVGDTIRIRVDGGQAWIIGNETAPPTDDTIAEEALKIAKSIRPTVKQEKLNVGAVNLLIGTQKPKTVTQFSWEEGEAVEPGGEYNVLYPIWSDIGKSADQIAKIKKVTLSYEWKLTTSGTTTGAFTVCIPYDTYKTGYYDSHLALDTVSIESDISGKRTVTVPMDSVGGLSDAECVALLYTYGEIPSGQSVTMSKVTISNMQLETGDYATDWCYGGGDVSVRFIGNVPISSWHNMFPYRTDANGAYIYIPINDEAIHSISKGTFSGKINFFNSKTGTTSTTSATLTPTFYLRKYQLEIVIPIAQVPSNAAGWGMCVFSGTNSITFA